MCNYAIRAHSGGLRRRHGSEGELRVRMTMTEPIESAGRAGALTGVGPAPRRTPSSHHQLALPASELRALDPRRHADTTIGALLVAALHLALSDWNADHYRETHELRVDLPVRRRTRAPDGPPGAVVTRPDDRVEARPLVRAVVRQLRRGPSGSAVAGAGAGGGVTQTAVLADLGRIDLPVAVGCGAGTTPPVWFAPPIAPAASLAVGVVGVDDSLNLFFTSGTDGIDAAPFAAYFAAALRFVG